MGCPKTELFEHNSGLYDWKQKVQFKCGECEEIHNMSETALSVGWLDYNVFICFVKVK